MEILKWLPTSLDFAEEVSAYVGKIQQKNNLHLNKNVIIKWQI